MDRKSSQEKEFRELAQGSSLLFKEMVKAWWPAFVLIVGTVFLMLASLILMVKLLFFT